MRTSSVRSAALVFAVALAAQETPLFRSDAEFVSVDVQVLSNNRPLTGLRLENFIVEDNGVKQPVRSISTENQPLDIVLLVDTSASTEHIQQMIKTYAAEAFTHLSADDRVGVVTFSTQPQVLVPPTLDRRDAIAKLAGIARPFGGTELNATILNTAVVLAQLARPDVRRSIVVLTDNCAERDVPDAEVRSELLRENMVVNALLFPAPCSGKDADVMPFAAATGGDVLNVDEELPLADMFRRMRQRYVLLYASPGGEPGTVRRIRVDVTPDLRAQLKTVTVRAREAYVVSAPLKTRNRVDPRIGQ